MRAFLCLSLLALTAGCATTTASDEPVYRLRPAPGLEGTREQKYTGNADVTLAFVDLGTVGSVNYGSGENVGVRLSARPSSWYVAPEVGINVMRENASGTNNELKATEAFAGGRVALRSTTLPFELYGSGGLSYLDSSVGPVNDESTGFYAGAGAYLYLGGYKESFGERGGPEGGLTLGIGYRYVDHDWDVDGWSEILATLGFAW